MTVSRRSKVRRRPTSPGSTDRVAQLEQALKALAEAAKDGGSVTDAAAISQQITEAEQRIQANLDKALADAAAANAATLQTMQASIDELKAKIAALAEAGLGGDDRPTSRRSPSASPSSRPAIDKGVAGTKSAAAAIAFANLSSRGRATAVPSRRSLPRSNRSLPDPGDLGPLPAYADKGIATVPELARSFAASRDAGARRRFSRAVRLAHRPAARQRLDPGQGQARR